MAKLRLQVQRAAAFQAAKGSSAFDPGALALDTLQPAAPLARQGAMAGGAHVPAPMVEGGVQVRGGVQLQGTQGTPGPAPFTVASKPRRPAPLPFHYTVPIMHTKLDTHTHDRLHTRTHARSHVHTHAHAYIHTHAQIDVVVCGHILESALQLDSCAS